MSDRGHGSEIPSSIEDGPESIRSIRHKLDHENELINHRVSWLATSQSFLTGAYVIRFNKDADTPGFLELGLPILGLVTTLLVYVSILGAFGAIHLTVAAQPPEQRRLFLTANTFTRLAGAFAPLGLPLVIAAGWLYALQWEITTGT
jgi:hypothetical protein